MKRAQLRLLTALFALDLALAAPCATGQSNQTATASGKCPVAVNAQGNAIVIVENNCDEASAKQVQRLYERARRTETKNAGLEKRLAALEQQRATQERLLEGLRAAVDAIEVRASRPTASEAERSAELLLQRGDTSGAVELLGQEAGALGSHAGTLYKQQAALLRASDSARALGALKRALAIEPYDMEALLDAGDICIALGQAREGFEFYSRVRRGLERQSLGPEQTYQLWVALLAIVDVEHVLGHRERSAHAAADSLALARGQVGSDKPGRWWWRRREAVSLERLGMAWLDLGNSSRALEEFEAARSLRETLAEENDDPITAQADLSTSYGLIGEALLVRGKLREARTATEKSLYIARQIANGDADNPSFRTRLAYGLLQLGDVRRAAEDFLGAKQAYEESKANFEWLVSTEPSSVRWQRDLASVYQRIGAAKAESKDRDGAIESYATASGLIQSLRGTDPDNKLLIRNAEVVRSAAALLQLETGKYGDALRSFEFSVAAVQSLAAEDPGNADLLGFTALLQQRLGFSRQMTGDIAGAEVAYRDALRGLQGLLASDPDNTKLRYILVETCLYLGGLEGSTLGLLERRAILEQGLSTLNRLPRDGLRSRDSAMFRSRLLAALRYVSTKPVR